MKVLYCLVEQKPIPPTFVSAYRVIECQEVDIDDRQAFDVIYQNYMQQLMNQPYLNTMFFWLPTMDVRTLIDKKEAPI